MKSKGYRYQLRVFLYLLPTFLFLFWFTYYPALRSFVDSFFFTRGGRTWFVGLQNYVDILTDRVFWQVVRNSLFYTAVTVPGTIAIALLLAVLLNRQLFGSTIYRTAFFYPMIIPYAAASMIWLYLLIPHYGVINRTLISLGLPNIEWVTDSRYAMWSIAFVGIWKNAGYFMMIFLAGLQQIPVSLLESAELDGAGALCKFRRITLPMISSTSFFVLIIAVIQSFQAIDQVYLMTRGGPGNATVLMVYYIYQTAFMFWNFNHGSTLTVFLVAALLAVTLFFFKVIEPRVHYLSEET